MSVPSRQRDPSKFVCLFVCLLVCGISLTSGQLFNELYQSALGHAFRKFFHAAGAVTASMR